MTLETMKGTFICILYVYIYLQIYIYVYKYICIQIYVYLCIYIHLLAEYRDTMTLETMKGTGNYFPKLAENADALIDYALSHIPRQVDIC
jgi:hypothetical protein